MLSQLVYSSDVRDLGPGGIQEILSTARRLNAANHVTGILLYNENYFFQALEGGRDRVTETFSRISVDRRHTNVTLMSVTDLEERGFPEWGMAYVGGSPDARAMLRRFQPAGDFSPSSLTAGAVLALVQRLHDLYTEA